MSTPVKNSRAKLLAIPALSTVLGVVVYCNFFSGSGLAPPAPPPRPSRITVEAGNVNLSASLMGRRTNVTWPKLELAEVVRHDPFLPLNYVPPTTTNVAQSKDTDAAAAERDHATPSHPNRPRVQAVYQRDGVTVAIIDSNIVRVGDILPGNGRVVELSASGIKFEEE